MKDIKLETLTHIYLKMKEENRQYVGKSTMK